jgi:enoyl-[acyl-carrier protein] reductase I
MNEFQNKNNWALILGGSSGLGLASAKKLAAHGMHICIVHRSPRHNEATLAKEIEAITAMGVQCLVFNKDALKEAKRNEILQALQTALGDNGQLKTLVHSIAKGNLKPMVSEAQPTLQHDDFALTLHAMAISLYDWTAALHAAQLFAQDARIISFTSEGNTKPLQHYAAVSAAKASLEAITRNIALEFAPYGIKANCIQAGITDTASMRLIPNSETLVAHTLKRHPNKRLTLPEDVANVVYLLSKDEARWITGTVLIADGGEHLL